jgi:glycosyltransferase involved in cell wall biosynthesis
LTLVDSADNEEDRNIVDPKVTFIVPCYNLAHLLRECVNSILSQTYGDFEILIMDDCSPDATPQVAQSFKDPRVKHIRNETNLRHLANYNKGIGMARGKYVWLISADDRLRQPYILTRYMEILERHPEVGYAFCPAVGMRDQEETGLLNYSYLGSEDAIIKGHEFFAKLMDLNCVIAASGMARKECYDKVSLFPLDMPYVGDWYLWGVFALYYDVAYFAEPMVNYRLHDITMTNVLIKRDRRLNIEEDLRMFWSFHKKLEEMENVSLLAHCKRAIIEKYVSEIVFGEDEKNRSGINLEEFCESLRRFVRDRREEEDISLHVYTKLGDRHHWKNDFSGALECYAKAIRVRPFSLKVMLRYILLRMGGSGILVRKWLSGMHGLLTAVKQSRS